MLISVVSSKNSPGATTSSLALTLAWPRSALLAELDPRGGDLLWGYGRGQNVGGAGLLRLQLTARSRSAADAVWSEVLELPAPALGKGPRLDSRWWLPGLTEPRQVGTVNWGLVVRVLRSVEDDVDVIADCGSVYGDPERLPKAAWTGADLVVLTVRPTLAGVHAARNAAVGLREDLMSGGLGPDRLVSVVVGCAHGYPLGEVVDELQDLAPVLGDLPYDPAAAETLNGLRDQRGRFARSALLRHASKVAAAIGSRVVTATPTADAQEAVGIARAKSVPPKDDGVRPAPILPGPTSAAASSRVPSQWPVVPAAPPPPVPRPNAGIASSPMGRGRS